MKKTTVAAIVGVILAGGLLSGCGDKPKAGDLCSVTGTTAQDAQGHELFCEINVWVRVQQGE